MRGYFGIGVENLKIQINLGTLWRSAYNLGASFIFVIGDRYKKQSSDTVKAYRHIPFYYFEDSRHFLYCRPLDCKLIGVEINDNARDIVSYVHPERAIYVLGAEDDSLTFQNECESIIKIPTIHSLNVSVAASIVMYDRLSKKMR